MKRVIKTALPCLVYVILYIAIPSGILKIIAGILSALFLGFAVLLAYHSEKTKYVKEKCLEYLSEEELKIMDRAIARSKDAREWFFIGMFSLCVCLVL